MTASISAQVRRILMGHSDRAFIHAVDDNGLEYKIEVPLEAVRGVNLDQGHILVISWSFQAASRTAERAAEPRQTNIKSNSPPSAVDQAFMELMASSRSPASLIAATATPSPSSGDSTRVISPGLAEVFGIKTNDESRRT